MRLLRADIVGHFDTKGTRYAVYSMDIQPNSNRLATGGGDCSVKLWNFDALLSSPANANEALLSTLSSHTKSVNVVRWSKDGKYLASGSDDNYILIHKYTPGAISNQTFGSSSAAVKNKETWTRCFSLQGHSMDILDLDWHSGPVDAGYTLASASVDNHIMVWNVHPPANAAPSLVPSYGNSASSTLISPKRILSGHDSFVKGLSYDPVGRYLLSSGSDNRIIVWDVENDYSILKVLEEPLRNAPDKTIFRRISWSPDGQSVCVTSAQKSSKPIGMVLKRGTWESVADLVGHTSSSISAKFCTHVLQQAGATAAPAVSCAVALGDQNGVLSVWSTHSNRPMYVLRDVCDGAITDVAWARGASQTALVCCGIDGTVVIADFEAELGRALTPAALEKHFQALYGRNMNELQQRPQALIENTLALQYALPPAPLPSSNGNGANYAQNGQKKRIELSGGVPTNGASPMSSFANRGTNNSQSSLAGGQPSQATQPPQASSSSTLQMQQRTEIVGGKKRIRPVLMQNNLDSPSEVTSAALPSHSSAPDLNGFAQQARSSNGAASYSTSSNGVAFAQDGFADDSAMDTGDDGGASKHRRTDPPVLVHSQSAPQMPGVLRKGNISQAPSTSAAARSHMMPPSSNNTVGSAAGASAARGVERVMTIRFENDETVCTVPLMGHQQVLRKSVRPAPAASNGISPPDASNASSSGLSSLFLDPSVYTNGNKNTVSARQADAPNFVLTAARLTKPALLAQLKHSGGKLSSLTLSSCTGSASELSDGSAPAGGGLWTAVVTGEVTCIAAAEFSGAGNGSATARGSMEGLCLAGCNDGTLHCTDLASGTRVGPPIVLGAAIAYVDIMAQPVTGSHTTASGANSLYIALAVTAEGELWKWEVNARTAKFRCVVRTNLRPVLLSMKCRSSGNQQGTPGATAGPNAGAGGSRDHGKDKKSVTLPGHSSSGKGGIAADAASAGATAGKKSDGVSIRIEQCVLSEAGEVVVHLMSATGGAEGGDWQAFSYDECAMVWTRLADMRYVLSSLFSVRTLGTPGSSTHQISTDTLQGASSTVDETQQGRSAAQCTSLSALQALAATGAKFGTKDVIGIAAAKQASNYSLNMGGAAAVDTLGSLQDITHAVGGGSTEAGSSNKKVPSVEDWSNLVTVSHVEDRLSVALSLGQNAEIQAWLSAWVGVCCKNLLTGRLQWLARQLIEQHTLRSSTAASSSPTAGPGPGPTIVHNNRRFSSLAEWIQSLAEPLMVLQRSVMPVIAQHPAVHSLLTDVAQTIELLTPM